MDSALIAVIAFTQLVLGGLGVYVSLRPPKPEHHWRYIAAFMGIGFIGIGLTVWLAQRGATAQEKSNDEIHQAQIAATNANTAATNANNSVLEEQKETKDARNDAKLANDKLTQLINSKSKETNTAILNLGAETKASVKLIAAGPPPRHIPPENRTELIHFLSSKHATVQVSAIANDGEAFAFAQEWYDVLRSSGWDTGSGVTSFIRVGPPEYGVVIKFHGEPVGAGQPFFIPDWEPAGAIAKALSALKTVASGQRAMDITAGTVQLEVLGRPPGN